MSEQQDSLMDTAISAVRGGARQRQGSLERRLADGYQRIDEAAFRGEDVTEWEIFWIKLLREYEDVCRELNQAA